MLLHSIYARVRLKFICSVRLNILILQHINTQGNQSRARHDSTQRAIFALARVFFLICSTVPKRKERLLVMCILAGDARMLLIVNVTAEVTLRKGVLEDFHSSFDVTE